MAEKYLGLCLALGIVCASIVTIVIVVVSVYFAKGNRIVKNEHKTIAGRDARRRDDVSATSEHSLDERRFRVDVDTTDDAGNNRS